MTYHSASHESGKSSAPTDYHPDAEKIGEEEVGGNLRVADFGHNRYVYDVLHTYAVHRDCMAHRDPYRETHKVDTHWVGHKDWRWSDPEVNKNLQEVGGCVGHECHAPGWEDHQKGGEYLVPSLQVSHQV
jgi:hypothetical protein